MKAMWFLWYAISTVLAGICWWQVWKFLFPIVDKKMLFDHVVGDWIPAQLLIAAGVAGYYFVSLQGAKASALVKDDNQVDMVEGAGFWVGGALCAALVLALLNPSPDSNFLAGFLKIFAMGFFVLFMLVVSPLMYFGVLVIFPFFLVGVYSICITIASSKTEEIAKAHTVARRPNSQIESQLADAMLSGLKSDIELQKIINEMSPILRFFHTLTYKQRAAKYRAVKAAMDAQTEASKQRSALGKSAHELERARRNE